MTARRFLPIAVFLLGIIAGILGVPLFFPALPRMLERVPDPFYWIGTNAQTGEVLLLGYSAPPDPFWLIAGSDSTSLPHGAIGLCPAVLPDALLVAARSQGRIEALELGSLVGGIRWLRVAMDDVVGFNTFTSLYRCGNGEVYPLFATTELVGLPLPHFGWAAPLLGGIVGLSAAWLLHRCLRAGAG